MATNQADDYGPVVRGIPPSRKDKHPIKPWQLKVVAFLVGLPFEENLVSVKENSFKMARRSTSLCHSVVSLPSSCSLAPCTSFLSYIIKVSELRGKVSGLYIEYQYLCITSSGHHNHLLNPCTSAAPVGAGSRHLLLPKFFPRSWKDIHQPRVSCGILVRKMASSCRFFESVSSRKRLLSVILISYVSTFGTLALVSETASPCNVRQHPR
jgi:hypothetical protein